MQRFGFSNKAAQHPDWASRSCHCDRFFGRHYRLSIGGRHGRDLEHLTRHVPESSPGGSFHCLCVCGESTVALWEMLGLERSKHLDGTNLPADTNLPA